MEIVSLGSEIVECVRIRGLIADHAEQFLARVYTPREARACQDRKKSTELFAACWAAKEAVMKCLASSKARRLPWLEIELHDPASAQPRVLLHGAAADRAAKQRITGIVLTTASCREYATATAMAIR